VDESISMPNRPRTPTTTTRVEAHQRTVRIARLRSRIETNTYVVDLDELALRIVEDGVLTR
jgi:anti-sigma28 factor (negative regulator of flagellin synthesis)